MTTKMQNRNILFDPIMEFLDGGLLSDIVYFAFLEDFLDDAFFFKVVDLFIYFIIAGIEHWLAVEK